jgi:hypothetical protein
LTDNLLKEMAKNTNSYAAEKRGDNEDDDDEEIMRTWEDVTPEEIGRWLGIVLYIQNPGLDHSTTHLISLGYRVLGCETDMWYLELLLDFERRDTK